MKCLLCEVVAFVVATQHAGAFYGDLTDVTLRKISPILIEDPHFRD